MYQLVWLTNLNDLHQNKDLLILQNRERMTHVYDDDFLWLELDEKGQKIHQNECFWYHVYSKIDVDFEFLLKRDQLTC